jgi:hypothetical protein
MTKCGPERILFEILISLAVIDVSVIILKFLHRLLLENFMSPFIRKSMKT